MKYFVYTIIGVLIFAGCERDLSGPTTDIDGLQITTEKDAFVITNRTNMELRLFLVESEAAAVISWAPYCLNTGLILQQEENTRVRFEEIYGYKPDCEVIVYWWPCVDTDGQLQPGTVKSTTLPTSG